MDEDQWMAQRFEEQRSHLRAVAYRMLGSLSEADDAVQDAWLRLSRSDVSDVENLRAWLTTVVARLCLNTLRSRHARREDSLEIHLPDPLVTIAEGGNPEQQAVLADSVGLALFVVLETLAPDERLAFVLHDMFGVPFDEIAPMVDRTPTAARQLASRARRRLRGKTPTPDRDVSEQRRVVDAFFAAAHRGDFEALVAVLDPEIILRADVGDARIPGQRMIRGARQVASQALLFSQPDVELRPVLINGAAGVVVYSGERVFSLMAFTVVAGKVAEINIIADPERLSRMDLPQRSA